MVEGSISTEIASKTSEAEIVFENDKYIAFLDINPVNYGHTLVIPKAHYDNFLTIPAKELEELMIPAQEYCKFKAKGIMTKCITDAWKEIWKSEIKRKFDFDFEVYDERSEDWNNAEVDIYISINK